MSTWNLEDFNEQEPKEFDISVQPDYDHMPNLNREDLHMEYKVSDKPKFLIEYVRKPNGQKKGVLMAFKYEEDDDLFAVIGWSLCCNKDFFDKDFGQELACSRGIKKFDYENHDLDIPYSMYDQMQRFVYRCRSYFKDCELPAWSDIF